MLAELQGLGNQGREVPDLGQGRTMLSWMINIWKWSQAWLFIYTTLKFVSISLHVHVPGSIPTSWYSSPSWTLTLCGQANFCRYRGRKKVGAELKQEQWFTCQKWEKDIVAKTYVDWGISANCFWPPWPRWRCPWWRCSCFSSAASPSGSWTGWRGCWSSAPQG